MFRSSILILATLLASCDTSPPLTVTPEQAVYEALFLELQGDAVQPYLIAGETESRWFLNNASDDPAWERRRRTLGEINADLVAELYRVNAEPSPLDWTPFITSGEVIEGALAREDPKAGGMHCLIEGESPIGIVDRERGSYRSYYSVSRAAFADNNTTALLKLSHHCAPLSGGGEFFVVFRKAGGQWTLASALTLWIS